MLYTGSVADLEKNNGNMIIYYIMSNKGNDEVSPDQVDLVNYHNGIITWHGFKLNYLSKLTKPEAHEWMRKASNRAVSENVILIDEETNFDQSCRKLLAELMNNMYSGYLDLQYVGELIKIKESE